MSNINLLKQLSEKLNEAPTELAHGRWTSSRLWVVLAFVVLCIFAAYFALQPAQLSIIASVVITFLVCSTVSKIAYAYFNAWMWVTARNNAGIDVTEKEQKELETLNTKK